MKWDQDSFRSRLADAKDAKRMSMEELAVAIGRKPAGVRAWLNRTVPPLGEIPGIASALGVSSAWLAFGEGARCSELNERGLKIARELEEKPELGVLLGWLASLPPDLRQALLTLAAAREAAPSAPNRFAIPTCRGKHGEMLGCSEARKRKSRKGSR
jgi:transcriptional regulator with XRE-family HTH domain